MRDSQKSKVYRSEDVLRPPFSKRIADINDCAKYLGKIWTSKWARKRFPVVQSRSLPTIVDGRGTRTAYGGLSRINLPKWARSEIVMLHELAHALAPSGEKHGRRFAEILLLLVRKWMGVEAFKLLKESYKDKGVKYRPRKKLSEETLQKLRERGRLLAQQLAARRVVDEPKETTYGILHE